MGQRDPRIDPRQCDVLWDTDDSGIDCVWLVTDRTSNTVSFSVACMDNTSDPIVVYPMADFALAFRDAKVLRVSE